VFEGQIFCTVAKDDCVFVSDCVGKCRNFSSLLLGKIVNVNIEWQHCVR